MIPPPDTATFVVGLMTAGTGGIFFWHDRQSTTSRALSLCLVAIGLRLFLSGADSIAIDGPTGWLVRAATMTLESVAILAGLDWGRRIGETASKNPPRAVKGLFLAAQILTLIYWGLSLGYLAIAPEQASTDSGGVVRVRGIEFAIFAPVLGTSMLLAGIAISILRFSGRIDPAESARLLSLSVAGPLLLAALVFSGPIIPITLTLGLLVFLSGSLRYLVIQSQRGQFMSQFLSPEVARMVRLEGINQTLKRERRVLSVVICDLRGFTQYARENDSEAVVQLLERFYKVVGKAAEKYAGTVKDHAGDGVLILVGAPLAVPDHAHQAVLLSLQIARDVKAVIRDTTPKLGLGIGVATGNLTIGAIRGAGRLEYVAVGNAVNLASRLCNRAESGEILSDARTLEGIPLDSVIPSEERPPEKLKGFPELIPVRALVA